MTEAGHYVHLVHRYEVLAPFRVLVDGTQYYFPGRFHGPVLVELYVRGPWNPGLFRCGDEFSVEIVRHRGQPLHDALDIHNHGFYRGGGKDNLLLDKAPCYGNPSPHEDLVSSTAHTCQVYAPCLDFLGGLDNLRVIDCHSQGLGKHWFVAVYCDIYLVLLEDSDIYLAPY